MIKLPLFWILLVGVLIIAAMPATRASAVATDFSFDNFSGTYYLDRNSKGVATLTVEEDMVVVFPPLKFYGIQRAIPQAYQDHNLDLKIISVTDTAGDPVDYRAYTDSQGNKVIQTGDPNITLSGLQTYKLKYQTTGVAAINATNDEFLVDVNGRGWQETFNSVKAFITVAKSFASNLTDKPICYIGSQNQFLNGCTLKQQTVSGGQLITVATTQVLGAHQALVVRLDFKKGTFNQKQSSLNLKLLAEIALALGCLGVGIFLLRTYIKGND